MATLQEDVLSPFGASDLDEIDAVMNQRSWSNIANCVKHEMYPKLGSTIQSIVDRDANGLYNVVDDKSTDQMMETLKNDRHLAAEERVYIRKLIQRAMERDDEKEHGLFVYIHLF